MATYDPKLARVVKALPAQRWASLIEAFPRVRAAVGGSNVLAAHDLTMKLRAGKLTAAGRLVGGAGDRCFIFTREFWLRAEIDPPFVAAVAVQRQEARLLGAGRWWFFFDRKQFDKLYPPAVPSAPKGSRAQDLIKQFVAKKWPDGWELVPTSVILKTAGEDEEFKKKVGMKAADKDEEFKKKVDLPFPSRATFERALGRRKD